MGWLAVEKVCDVLAFKGLKKPVEKFGPLEALWLRDIPFSCCMTAPCNGGAEGKLGDNSSGSRDTWSRAELNSVLP